MKLSDYEQMPTIEAIMTPCLYFAQTSDSLSQIFHLMEKHKIRHIPIKQGEQIVGIISERDLRWMKAPVLSLPDPEEIPVHYIQMNQPYIVETNTPLNTVIAEMSQKKIGSAIVVKSGKLSGIVTTIDICNALVELVESQFQPDH